MDDEAPLLLVETGRGLTVSYRNRNLYSPREPVAGAEKRAASVVIPPYSLVLLPSPVLFHGVATLLDRLPERCAVLAVEADEKLMAVSVAKAGAILRDPRITYVRAGSLEAVRQLLATLDLGAFRRCVEVRLTGGYSFAAAFYEEIFDTVQNAIQERWRNRMTLIQLSNLWTKNLLLNLPELVQAGDLGEVRVARPIVVVGAGESLEGAIPLIRELREELFLLAVDTARPSLAQAGLRPDALFVLEGQFVNVMDFVGTGDPKLEPVAEGHTLFADLCSSPAVLEMAHPPLTLFLSDFAPSALLRRLSAAGLRPLTIPPLGSVGIAALYCALELTDEAIFVAGIDFSFDPGKSHAKGTASHLAQLVKWSRISPPALFSRGERSMIRLLDKRAREVVSDPVLLSYHRLALDLLSRERRLFDVGARGLDLGISRCSSAEEMRRAMRRDPARGSERSTGEGRSPHADGPSRPSARRLEGGRRLVSPPERREAIRRFLRGELALLESAEGVALDWLEAPQRSEDSFDSAALALREVDYAYLHFPDSPPLPAPTEGFVKRAIESIERCRGWIGRSLDRVGPRAD